MTQLKVISDDLYRYTGSRSFFDNVLCFLRVPGAKYTVCLRLTALLRKKIWSKPLYLVLDMILKHYQFKFGIDIPYNTDIGHGLYIGHYGNIVISAKAIIGKNCNINHGVTIGARYGGKHPGVPIILDNVYLGPGSKIIGGITIGKNVAVGANCVVVSSVPENAVVVGVPGKIVSYNGATNYVVNTI